MEEKDRRDCAEQTKETPKKWNTGGGLYRGIKVPVKALTVAILVGMIALVGSVIFLSRHGGFTVTYDCTGGEPIPAVTAKYGDLLTEPEPPVRSGYTFVGWYTDPQGKNEWRFSEAPVEQSMTLYAVWEQNNP